MKCAGLGKNFCSKDYTDPEIGYVSHFSPLLCYKLTSRQSVFISDFGSFNMASIFSNRASMVSPADIFAAKLIPDVEL